MGFGPCRSGSLFPGRAVEAPRGLARSGWRWGAGEGFKGRHCFQGCLPVMNRSARCIFKVSIPSKPGGESCSSPLCWLAAGRGLQGMCDVLGRGQSQRVAAPAQGYLCSPADGGAAGGPGCWGRVRRPHFPAALPDLEPRPPQSFSFPLPGLSHVAHTQVDEDQGRPRSGEPAQMPPFFSPWARVAPPHQSVAVRQACPGLQTPWPAVPLAALACSASPSQEPSVPLAQASGGGGAWCHRGPPWVLGKARREETGRRKGPPGLRAGAGLWDARPLATWVLTEQGQGQLGRG